MEWLKPTPSETQRSSPVLRSSATRPTSVPQLNAIVLYVINTAGGTEMPMENISSLTVTLSYGGQEKLLEFEPLGVDTPGEFSAPILPAIAGEYEVIFGGTLGGLQVDAETHMDEVQPADVLAFPSVDAAQTSNAEASWLVWLSIAIGLVGVGLGALAIRKASTR